MTSSRFTTTRPQTVATSWDGGETWRCNGCGVKLRGVEHSCNGLQRLLGLPINSTRAGIVRSPARAQEV